MDRFKFRVYDVKLKMYRSDGYYINGNQYMDSYFEDVYDLTDDMIVEQCTGLKDKNGNLIYENDMLFDGEFCGQVIWKDGCWLVEMTLYDDDKSYEHLDQHFAKYGEIIGNIHEQKENQ